MSETIILMVVISNMLLTPVIQYLLTSRCYEIDCCCVKCKRNPIEMDIEDIKEVSKNNNQNNN